MGEPHLESASAPSRTRRPCSSGLRPTDTGREVACWASRPGVDENDRNNPTEGCGENCRAAGAVEVLSDRAESSVEGFAEARIARGGSSSARRAAPETMMTRRFA